VPLDASGEVIAAITRTHGRIVGATDEEIESAVVVVRSVLAHPLLADARRALQAGRCLRETPVTVTIDDILVEGVVDCAFDTGETVTVIDFKTDHEIDGALETYRRQVQLYAHAIAAATGRPTRGVWLKV
jgi:ATP-dependent exoDNAse (exonuclease V) beta subunit